MAPVNSSPQKPKPMGFFKVDPNTATKPRMIVSIEGETKHGKNHFAFTMPGPIGFHSFDYGDEGMIEKFIKGRGVRKVEIHKAEYRLDIPPDSDVQKVSNAATPVWSAFATNY